MRADSSPKMCIPLLQTNEKQRTKKNPSKKFVLYIIWLRQLLVTTNSSDYITHSIITWRITTFVMMSDVDYVTANDSFNMVWSPTVK